MNYYDDSEYEEEINFAQNLGLFGINTDFDSRQFFEVMADEDYPELDEDE